MSRSSTSWSDCNQITDGNFSIFWGWFPGLLMSFPVSLIKLYLCCKYNCSCLMPVQTECVIRCRIGQFNARVKRAQIDNSLSYCVNTCELCRSERAITLKCRFNVKQENHSLLAKDFFWTKNGSNLADSTKSGFCISLRDSLMASLTEQSEFNLSSLPQWLGDNRKNPN